MPGKKDTVRSRSYGNSGKLKWPWPEVRQLVRQIAITEQTYYRWRNEYGGLSIDQAKKLKKLALENARLRRAVADLTLDKLILEEAAVGNFQALHVAANMC